MDSRNARLFAPPRELLASLETVATECPSSDVLGYVVLTLLNSPARPDLVAIADRWGIKPQDLAFTLTRTAHGLFMLERRRGGWRTPGQVIESPPSTLALLQLARVRRDRVDGIGRCKRLDVIIRKLERVYATESTKARITAFLRPPSTEPGVNISAWIGPLS